MPYTRETLLPNNHSYNIEHYLTEKDVEMVNALVARIEASRSEQQTPAPLDGDILIYTNRDGEERRANIEVRTYHQAEEAHMEICTHAYIPFIDKESLHTNTSGGPWYNITIEEFGKRAHYVGRGTKYLKAWGHMGMWKDGAIQFEAQVNVWKIDGTL